MTINTEPYALMDLFGHVIAGRANAGEINALIDWLQSQKQRLQSADYERNRRVEFLETQLQQQISGGTRERIERELRRLKGDKG